jgi:DNA topoisomerase I
MAKNLLVVESPAKAKTIKKYLGPGYEVLASYGHVRDLRPKEGAVEPDQDFAMHYEVIERSEKHIAALARALRKADALYLATDPDREGEAIAWHVVAELENRGAVGSKPVHRVVFHEITRRAILEAMEHPREVSADLVNAQQARRALDYLVGFNLSPLLWKKIRPGLSAGRVQSPALRLIVEREDEIERFVRREYWTLEADASKQGAAFLARLSRFAGEKLEQFSIGDGTRANEIHRALEAAAGGRLAVVAVERKQRRRNPAAPFITSTLQQEAARKLGFTAQRTMRVAQQLYEGIDTGSGAVGLITYMRTDSVTLANDAVAEIRGFIAREFGRDAVPAKPRAYRTRAKNAQEAHEAIRPTMVEQTPDALRPHLNDDQRRLYQLVWQRTVASQMRHATIDTVAVDLVCGADPGPGEALGHRFRANGSSIAAPGFLAVYEEGVDDPGAEEDDRRLPPLEVGDVVDLEKLRAEQHFTEPPPRYTEASLIRTLEEYGIGRPSTYAAIISTLQQREYVELDRKRFQPTDVGRMVNTFLTEHFGNYVDYDFTARLEDQLDAVSRGEREWVPLMKDFWEPFHRQVEDKEASVSRRDASQARVLGQDPKTGREVTARLGRFGAYAQLGAAEEEEKPRFAGLRPDQRINTISLEEALALFELPRDLGATPEGEPMLAGRGRFGPYVKFGERFVSMGKDDDPHTITPERAQELVREKKRIDAERNILSFEGGIRVLKGRYGPYVTDGKRNARVPKDRDPGSLTLEESRRLLAEAPPSRGRRRGGARKAG